MRTGKQIFYTIVVIMFIWLLFMFFTNPYVSERKSKETRQIQRLIQRKEDRINPKTDSIQRLIQRKEDRFNLNSNVTWQMRLPDVIIVGVKKSGTMTLGKSLIHKE